MSSIARWTYTNTADVLPLTGVDEYGKSTYGTPYTIACTWGTDGKQERGAQGAELADTDTIYTEDPRPQRLDKIKLNGHDEFQEIRGRIEYDMSPFGDTPDYKLTT